MKVLYPLYLISLLNTSDKVQQTGLKQVSRYDMQVNWKFVKEKIRFEVSAPTKGWMAIGFNEEPHLKGTYLLMMIMRDGIPTVEEHYTFEHGDYRSFSSENISTSVLEKSGSEFFGRTRITFELPLVPKNQFARNLSEGTYYHMVMAFSRDDDFQHHSMMRTTVRITL